MNILSSGENLINLIFAYKFILLTLVTTKQNLFMRKLAFLLLIPAIALSACTCMQKNSPFEKKASDCMATLLAWRDFKTGIWETAGWWNSANLLTAVVRYSEVTGSDELYPVIDDLFTRAHHYYVAEEPPRESWYADNFIGTYYDDEGWWALAWIDAYNLTGDARYLEVAEIIFEDLTMSWDELCDGGIYWKKGDMGYKNSISSSLFTQAAGRLYEATGDARYREWFEKGVQWFLDKKLINEQTFYVEDGLRKGCVPDSGHYYTYNQGITLGFLAEMYQLSGDGKYLELAEKIADATISPGSIFVTGDGILCERNPDIERSGDGVQFKGAFIRNLGRLCELTGKKEYRDFILRNAESIVSKNYDPASRSFGYLWYGPFEGPNAPANSSALECVIEAYALTK